MRRLVLLSAAALMLMAAKPDEVKITDASFKRDGDLIVVETTIRNTGAKPIEKLAVVYKFYSLEHEVMSTQRTGLEEVLLQPGAESEVHAQLNAPPRALTVEISAQAGSGRELRVGGPGPYTIE